MENLLKVGAAYRIKCRQHLYDSPFKDTTDDNILKLKTEWVEKDTIVMILEVVDEFVDTISKTKKYEYKIMVNCQIWFMEPTEESESVFEKIC